MPPRGTVSPHQIGLVSHRTHRSQVHLVGVNVVAGSVREKKIAAWLMSPTGNESVANPHFH